MESCYTFESKCRLIPRFKFEKKMVSDNVTLGNIYSLNVLEFVNLLISLSLESDTSL